jgi:DNA-binding MarR family transcriptional regulator
MAALAAAERVTPATVTSTVTGLESAGLVRRTRRSADARQVTVEATPDGFALMDASRMRRIAVLTDGLSGLSTVELKALDVAIDAVERMVHKKPC